MLRFSTKGRYGVRAMMELAMHLPGEPVLMSTIAERQGISRKYLHALLTSLRAAGLVRSVRGAQGGYTLSRLPAQIKVSEVVEALEGPLALTDCVIEDGICHRSPDCTSRRLWVELSTVLRQHLASLTLQDLVEGKLGKAGGATDASGPAAAAGQAAGAPAGPTTGERHR